MQLLFGFYPRCSHLRSSLHPPVAARRDFRLTILNNKKQSAVKLVKLQSHKSSFWGYWGEKCRFSLTWTRIECRSHAIRLCEPKYLYYTSLNNMGINPFHIDAAVSTVACSMALKTVLLGQKFITSCQLLLPVITKWIPTQIGARQRGQWQTPTSGHCLKCHSWWS